MTRDIRLYTEQDLYEACNSLEKRDTCPTDDEIDIAESQSEQADIDLDDAEKGLKQAEQNLKDIMKKYPEIVEAQERVKKLKKDKLTKEKVWKKLRHKYTWYLELYTDELKAISDRTLKSTNDIWNDPKKMKKELGTLTAEQLAKIYGTQ